MTTRYAIVAFPEFDEPNPLEAVRHAFDPQVTLLPAHVTFVFPFVAVGSESSLREHIEACLVRTSSFDIVLAPPTPAADGYLSLGVVSGRDRIVDLHDRLYSGPLESQLSTSHPYDPHVTLGRLDSPGALASALATARATLPRPLPARIDHVHLFRIEPGAGHVACSFPLVSAGAP